MLADPRLGVAVALAVKSVPWTSLVTYQSHLEIRDAENPQEMMDCLCKGAKKAFLCQMKKLKVKAEEDVRIPCIAVPTAMEQVEKKTTVVWKQSKGSVHPSDS